ncbi:MAG: formate dehydrogenase [Bacillota bacterium]
MKDLLVTVGQDGRTQALREFLAKLLEVGAADALLVPAEAAPGTITHVLARDVGLVMRAAEPLAPVMPVNAASVVSEVVRKGPRGRVAALLRPCEMRALVELVKLKQAAPENILAIGIDCLGTCDPVAYREASGRRDDLPVREACRVCLNPTPSEAALPGITLGFIGLDSTDGIVASLSDGLDQGLAAVIEKLGLTEGEAAQRKRKEAVQALMQERRASYDAFIKNAESAVSSSGIEAFARELAGCTGCHNCRVACPLCYCRECIFDTDTFEYETGQFLRRSGRKGGLKVPQDTVLYHLTRMNHMSLSCVGCGSCEAACPVHLPLFRLFAMASRRTQAVFGYPPGRSVDDELPFTTFREEELEPR